MAHAIRRPINRGVKLDGTVEMAKRVVPPTRANYHVYPHVIVPPTPRVPLMMVRVCLSPINRGVKLDGGVRVVKQDMVQVTCVIKPAYLRVIVPPILPVLLKTARVFPLLINPIVNPDGGAKAVPMGGITRVIKHVLQAIIVFPAQVAWLQMALV